MTENYRALNGSQLHFMDDIIGDYGVFCVYEEIIMENYITLKEAAAKWGISERRIRILCTDNRIEGASKMGPIWVIPADAIKPDDKRIKSGKYIKDRAE